MSITPNRDAALKAIAVLEQSMAKVAPATDGAAMLARQLQIDLSRNFLLFNADMLDRGEPESRCAHWSSTALAPAIASLMMTLCGGEKHTAEFAIMDFMMKTVDRARPWLSGGGLVAVATEDTSTRAHGRA